MFFPSSLKIELFKLMSTKTMAFVGGNVNKPLLSLILHILDFDSVAMGSNVLLLQQDSNHFM